MKQNFIIFGFVALVAFLGLTSPAITGNAVYEKTVEAVFKDFFNINKIVFEKNSLCSVNAGQFFDALKFIAPQKTSQFTSQNFANILFQDQYDVGKIIMVKDKQFLKGYDAQIYFDVKKLVFGKYSDFTDKISLSLLLNGEVKNNQLIITKGSLKSDMFECGF